MANKCMHIVMSYFLGITMRHFIGIDIGSASCFAAVSNGLTPTELPTFSFDNSAEGVTKFTNWLSSLGCTTESSVLCMESCGVYAETVCYCLIGSNWKIAVEPPHKIARSMPANSAKTDISDARRIARYAARYADELHFWTPPSEVIEHVTTLLALREGYTRQSTALQNQLHSIERKYIRTTEAETMLRADIIRCKERIEELDKELKRWIDSDCSLKKMVESVDSVPGIGQTLAIYLLVITDYRLFSRRLFRQTIVSVSWYSPVGLSKWHLSLAKAALTRIRTSNHPKATVSWSNVSCNP